MYYVWLSKMVKKHKSPNRTQRLTFSQIFTPDSDSSSNLPIVWIGLVKMWSASKIQNLYQKFLKPPPLCNLTWLENWLKKNHQRIFTFDHSIGDWLKFDEILFSKHFFCRGPIPSYYFKRRLYRVQMKMRNSTHVFQLSVTVNRLYFQRL